LKLTLCILILFLTIQFGYAQKEVSVRPDSPMEHPLDALKATGNFTKIPVKGALESELTNRLNNLHSAGTSLKLLHTIESPVGMHYTYVQQYNGYDLYQSQVKVNMDKLGNIVSMFDFSFPIAAEMDAIFPEATVVSNYFGRYKRVAQPTYTVDKQYYYDGTKMVAALRVELTEGDRHQELVFGSDGTVLYQRDLNTYAKDTTVTGMIFLPDPLTTAETEYGAPYIDSEDTDVPVLNAQRQSVTTLATFDETTNTFVLTSPYVEITEHSLPFFTPTTSLTPEFNFTRSEQGFEEFNALYHINKIQVHIQNLGFNNLVNFPIPVDVHGLGGGDQSVFSFSGNQPKLTFGEGGVDDAEDADVVVHEYGHAISHSAAPGTNVGSQRTALDEANGDYIAASYSRQTNPYNWEQVFSWDGHNEFWSGRMVQSNDHYPEDLTGNLYGDADIWSSTLMQLYGDIGRSITDKILFQSMYGYSSHMQMSDAARLYLQADSLLHIGLFEVPICIRFSDRGLWSDCNSIDTTDTVDGLPDTLHLAIAVHNTFGFTYENENLVVVLNDTKATTATVYNSLGQAVWSAPLAPSLKQFEISPADFPRGIYFLKVDSPTITKAIKLAKFTSP